VAAGAVFAEPACAKIDDDKTFIHRIVLDFHQDASARLQNRSPQARRRMGILAS
jgi:hypothetical protein